VLDAVTIAVPLPIVVDRATLPDENDATMGVTSVDAEADVPLAPLAATTVVSVVVKTEEPLVPVTTVVIVSLPALMVVEAPALPTLPPAAAGVIVVSNVVLPEVTVETTGLAVVADAL
jgi:hypothetical protein